MPTSTHVPGSARDPLPQPLLKASQVATLLQVSKGWVYQHARSGELPCVRLSSGSIRFERDAVLARLDGQRASWPPGSQRVPS